jgi:hypothetical protein
MSVIISDNNNSSYGTSVATITITNGGIGYTLSDSLALSGGSMNCTINVDGVDGNGVITGATITATGDGYALSGYTTTGGTGSDAQITVSSLYNGFSTPNSFYRIEASNMGLYGAGNLQFNTAKYVNITFSNAGNCLGVTIPLIAYTAGNNRGVIASLEEYQSVTSFDTGTEKVNKIAHGLNNDDIVSFGTTGVLPTGIVAGTQYYVINKSADDFQISTSIGGSIIGLSGTPSGTWDVGVQRATKELTIIEISGPLDTYPLTSPAVYNSYGSFITSFVFTSPYPVTTTAGIYRLRFIIGSGTVGTWYVKTSDVSISISYAVWCDTKVSFSTDDILIVKDKIIIDQNVTLGGVLGVSEATCGTSAWICSKVSDPITNDNVCLLEWQNPPIASYTLTVKGRIYFGTLSGLRVGTSTNRIPYAKKAIITFTTPAVGTLASGLGTIPNTVVASSGIGGQSLFLYGEIPTYLKTNLLSDAAMLQSHLLTTDNVNWVNGDQIAIGKSYSIGQGQTALYTVSGVTGNDITLTANVATFSHKAGGTIIRFNYCGILFQNDVSVYVGQYAPPANFILSGVDFLNYEFTMSTQTTYYYMASFLKSTLRSQWLIQDCTARGTSTNISNLISIIIPSDGMLIQRVYTHRLNLCYIISSYYTTYYSSGRFTMRDCSIVSQYRYGFSPGLNCRWSMINNSFENSTGTASVYTCFLILRGIEIEYYDNKLWGNPTPTAVGTVLIGQCVNPIKIGPNYYNYNLIAMEFGASATIKCLEKDSVFGNEYPNTTDIYLDAGCIPDYIYKNLIAPSGGLVIDTTNIEDMIVGSRIGFTNFNGLTYDDRNIYTLGRTQRTGSGLSDETVHTSGTGKYAMRLESTSSAGNIEFSQEIPTGNIQNLTITITAWIKINSSVYYNTTHLNPTMFIDYDDGTIVSSGSTNTTDWQMITMSVTPITTTGVIILTIGGYTEATGSDAYFYIDDITISYPPGSSIDLGGLDIWNNALPITPSINLRTSAKTMVTTDGNVLIILHPELGSDSQLLEV